MLGSLFKLLIATSIWGVAGIGLCDEAQQPDILLASPRAKFGETSYEVSSTRDTPLSSGMRPGVISTLRDFGKFKVSEIFLIDRDSLFVLSGTLFSAVSMHLATQPLTYSGNVPSPSGAVSSNKNGQDSNWLTAHPISTLFPYGERNVFVAPLEITPESSTVSFLSQDTQIRFRVCCNRTNVPANGTITVSWQTAPMSYGPGLRDEIPNVPITQQHLGVGGEFTLAPLGRLKLDAILPAAVGRPAWAVFRLVGD